jgi:hypothetical protein
MENWKQLTRRYNSEINKVLQIHHLAAQFISLTGRYLLPEKEDQGNITMQFIPDQQILLGRQHPDGWLVSLQLEKLLLQVRNDNMTVVGEIPLEGKTFPEVLLEFKKELHKTGVDVTFLQTEQPYELPSDSLNEVMFFSAGPEDAEYENLKYLHNASLVLNKVRSDYAGACPLRIWPNHFDTGFTFPVEHNKEGKETKTIGMGWAIPDHIVNEPYYYLSFLSEEPINENSYPGDLSAGKWMMPEWNGAVLTLSEIIKEENAENQFAMVELFLNSAAQRIVDHFKVSQ